MGIYLNCKKPYSLFASEKAKPYFVDKSMILKELIPFVQSGKNYICIIRPRRFGKTVMANMIGAFFSKGKDSKGLFQDMEISTVKESEKYTSQYNVIYITLNEVPDECCSFRQYMARIKKILTEDLMAAFPEYSLNPAAPIWDILNKIYEEGDFRFLFVLDEWDFIFHRDFVTEGDKREYIHFLSCLLKDQPYVLLAYMTGILPIAKYSSGSEMNLPGASPQVLCSAPTSPLTVLAFYICLRICKSGVSGIPCLNHYTKSDKLSCPSTISP